MNVCCWGCQGSCGFGSGRVGQSLEAFISMLAAPVVCLAAEAAGGAAAAAGQRPAGVLWLTCVPLRWVGLFICLRGEGGD